MYATLTPLPVIFSPLPSRRLWAEGVDGSRNAVRVTWSASGSSVLHSAGVAAVGEPNETVGDDREDVAARGERVDLGGGELRRERVDEAERLGGARLRRLEIADERRVHLRERAGARAQIVATAEVLHLIAIDHDHLLLLQQRRRERRMRARRWRPRQRRGLESARVATSTAPVIPRAIFFMRSPSWLYASCLGARPRARPVNGLDSCRAQPQCPLARTNTYRSSRSEWQAAVVS